VTTPQKRKHNSSPSQAFIGKKLLGDFILEDVHTYRLSRHDFIIYLGGEETEILGSEPESYEPGVEHNMADRFERNLCLLSGINRARPILVIQTTCGGDWDAGIQILNAIIDCPNPVTVLATKWARSMSSIIPLAADRFVLRASCKYMYHHGSFSSEGLMQEARTQFIELEKSREMMLRIYTGRLKAQGKFTRWSQGCIYKMLNEEIEKRIDVWLDADEAVRWGFADSVFEGNQRTLRAKQKNTKRREQLRKLLRVPIRIDINVS